jgi:hypothetical protein
LSVQDRNANLLPMTERLRARGAPLVLPSLAIVGVLLAVVAARPATPDPPAVAQQVPSGFTHDDHETLQCFTCHENTAGHGALTVTTPEDCRACHHAPATAVPCQRCHTEAPTERFEVSRAVAFSVPAGDPHRSLAFPHDRHATIDCARCHTQGTALAVAADLDCESCHQDHHTTASECASCHAPVHVSAHPPAEVHLTCSGAACHQDVPFESVPRTRAFCLGCHRAMSQHEAPRDCAECHILPAPRGSP